jgi:hypothetical protein
LRLLVLFYIVYFINVFVAKLGTAATGNFLSGKREREKGGGGAGKLQAVNSETVEAAYCDHFGTDINW